MKDNDTLQFLQPLIKSIHMESEEYQNKGEKKLFKDNKKVETSSGMIKTPWACFEVCILFYQSHQLGT